MVKLDIIMIGNSGIVLNIYFLKGSGKTSLINTFKHIDDEMTEISDNGRKHLYMNWNLQTFDHNIWYIFILDFKHSHMPTLGVNLEKKVFNF